MFYPKACKQYKLKVLASIEETVSHSITASIAAKMFENLHQEAERLKRSAEIPSWCHSYTSFFLPFLPLQDKKFFRLL